MQEETIVLIDITMSRPHDEYSLFRISILYQSKITGSYRSIANVNCEQPSDR